MTTRSPGPRQSTHDESRQSTGLGPWRTLHLWQIQLVRDLLVLGVLAGLVWLGYRLSVVTVPMLIALTLAYLCEPLVRRLEHSHRVRRPIAAGSLIALGLVLIVLPAGLGLTIGVAQGARAARHVAANAKLVADSVQNPDDPALRDKLPGEAWVKLRDTIVRAERSSAEDPTGADDLIRSAVAWTREHGREIGSRALTASANIFTLAIAAAGSVGAALVGAGLTLIFFYFFCVGYGDVRRLLDQLVPRSSRGRYLLGRMDRAIAGFVRGRLTIGAIMAVHYTLGYWLIGVPAPLIIGPLVGLSVVVPYLSGLGVPMAMLLLWFAPGDSLIMSQPYPWWWLVFAPAAVFAVAQALDDYVLSPLIVGKNTDMSIPSIIFASLAGASLGGFYGLLLAIPVAACLKILIKEVFWPRVLRWARGDSPDMLPIAREESPTSAS